MLIAEANIDKFLQFMLMLLQDRSHKQKLYPWESTSQKAGMLINLTVE